jgi:prepilin peptidase dependent protein B
MSKIFLQPKRGAHSQRGLSIVEFMVGVTIGLLVVGGAIKVFVDLFNNNRRQLVEVRLNQDLRAAADIIARDLRRSGYKQDALAGVTAAGPASAPSANAYTSAAATVIAANQVNYAYDRDGDNTVSIAEASGFRLNTTTNTIDMLVGGAWQPLTDPSTVRITNFTINNAASATQMIAMAQYCPCIGNGTCTLAAVAAGASAPQAVKRWVNIVIEGRAANDAAMPLRRISEAVHLRNDEIRGECPT